MAEISIAYTVPVQVIVDTDTRQVLRVVVCDEQISQNRSGYCENVATEQAPTAIEQAAAYDMAEAAAWPGWQFEW